MKEIGVGEKIVAMMKFHHNGDVWPQFCPQLNCHCKL